MFCLNNTGLYFVYNDKIKINNIINKNIQIPSSTYILEEVQTDVDKHRHLNAPLVKFIINLARKLVSKVLI